MYWLPVWHILEDDFELTLCNAAHVKNVPGRKTDVCDAQWLCQLMEAGLSRGSFVAPKPQRRLRALTGYRKTQIAERQRALAAHGGGRQPELPGQQRPARRSRLPRPGGCRPRSRRARQVGADAACVAP
ncbi:MAG: IS110 family transposase [Solirubrobacteraceae bacterium]